MGLPRGGHDDYANVLALAAASLSEPPREILVGRFYAGSGGGVEIVY